MARRLNMILCAALVGAGCSKKAEPADTSAPPAVPIADAAPADAAPAPADDAAPPPATPDVAGAPTDAAAAPTPSQLTPAGLDARHPRVSPDARRVAFHAGPEGKRDIHLVALDGTGLVTLVADPADDRDPTWTPDGKRLVFSSNRAGRYDLYVMDVDPPSPPTALGVGADVDALEPSVSPLRYTFSAVTPNSCMDEGASGDLVDSYEKLVFTRVSGNVEEIWFRSLNGKHTGRLSPAGKACWGARYSGDGLSLAMTCADSAGAPVRVVHDTRAVWDQSFAAALKAVGYTGQEEELPGCAESDPKQWESDACLGKLPRRYARHEPAPVPDPSGDFEATGYSANQTLLLGTSSAGAATHERTDAGRWTGLDVPGAGDVGALDWTPDGGAVVVEKKNPDGTRSLTLSPTRYYLQDVKDLVDYPELWGKGRSALLAKNRFVVRAGDAKEFFEAYDKTMYARRAPFVTVDAVLQVVRDEIAALLKVAEQDAADELLGLMKGLMDEYAGRPDTGHARYLATQFAVAWAALAAAERVPQEDAEPSWEEPPPDAPPEKTPIEKIRGELPAVLAELPASIKAEATAHIQKALAHEGFVEVKVPGRDAPVPVDFSQMKPRGHYAESTLAGYFIAMKWLSMVPLPLDGSAVELVRVLEKTGLIESWKKIDQMVGAFMGRPIDVTVSHVQALLAKDPGILEPTYDKAKAEAAFKSQLGELGIRGLAAALADDKGQPAPEAQLSFMLFPLRLGLDVPTFTGLTHPAVQGRGLPSAVDVLAALDVPAAVRIATEQDKGKEWQASYEAALAALRGKAPSKDSPLWSADLYHGWLALLRTLATPMKTPAEARMLFADSPAWADRLVSTGLGGYAQLKHDAVLYAFQDFSAQCDSAYSLMVFVEQPILPEPRGFVEPNPEFFRAAAALVKKAYAAFGGGEEPRVMGIYDADGNEVELNARILVERLGKIAERELAGQPLLDADRRFLRTIGGTFEAVFLGQQKTQGPSVGKGRLERGIALVTDVHTNVTEQVALHLGLGRIDKLFVAVPDAVGARMTEGGVFAFYEFSHPIADRLTDDEWQQRIVGGTLPPRPAWVSSFFEATAK